MRTIILMIAMVLGFTSFGVPFCALRSGHSTVTEENWPKVLEAIRSNRAAFDEVWFSTGISYPPIEWHREQSRRCAKAAADLRELGIEASVEIQATIGHVDASLSKLDCRAQDWETWVGWDGAVAKRCSCPRAKGLKEYFRKVAAIYAEWKPGCVWVDDDLRLNNRAPSIDVRKHWGCWCKNCIAAFSKAEGHEWTRESLLKEIEGGNLALQERWKKCQIEGLSQIASAIAEEVHRVSPNSDIGSQFGAGHGEVIKAMYESSQRLVRIRPGAGAYWDSDPHKQISKAFYCARSADQLNCREIIRSISPEIETCPRTFFCRTPQGVILEAFEQLACGADCLSMFIADTRNREDWSYYRDKLFKRVAASHEFLLKFKEANKDARPCGFAVPEGCPDMLVECRGIPIVTKGGLALADLPDINEIPSRLAGAAWQATGSTKTQIMQVASGPDLLAFAKKADDTCGGRTPIMFSAPVMAFAMPNVLEDGTLRTVAIVNASIDVQDPVEIRLRGVPAGSVLEWRPLHGEATRLTYICNSHDVITTIPAVAAWDCGYIAVVKQ